MIEILQEFRARKKGWRDKTRIEVVFVVPDPFTSMSSRSSYAIFLQGFLVEHVIVKITEKRRKL